MNNLKLPEPRKGIQSVPHARAVECFRPDVTAKAGSDTITILGDIGENWDGTGITPKRIEAALRSIGDKPVTAIINSPGGSFYDGLAIYNMFRNHSKPVTAQIVGLAGSAASIIAMGAQEIQIAKAGLMFVHNTQWIAIGDRHVMLQTHEDMKVFDDVLAGLYHDRTGLPLDQLHALMDAETFLSGEDTVAKGFADGLLPADEVVTVDNSAEPAHRKVAAALAKAGMPRAEIRALMKEFSADMPGAVADPAMPGAGETEADGLNHLRVAAMKLSLCRA